MAAHRSAVEGCLRALPMREGSAAPPLQLVAIHISFLTRPRPLLPSVQGNELRDAAALAADSSDVEVDAPGLAKWRPPRSTSARRHQRISETPRPNDTFFLSMTIASELVRLRDGVYRPVCLGGAVFRRAQVWTLCGCHSESLQETMSSAEYRILTEYVHHPCFLITKERLGGHMHEMILAAPIHEAHPTSTHRQQHLRFEIHPRTETKPEFVEGYSAC